MFDGVFHHGLQNQAGNLGGTEFTRNAHAHLKPLRKSHLLDVEILEGKVQFLAQRHLLPAGILHHAAQKVAQPSDHAHGCIVSFLAHQAGDGVERIEQKVRLDLPAQCVELGLRELLVEPRGLGLLMGQARAGVQHVAN